MSTLGPPVTFPGLRLTATSFGPLGPGSGGSVGGGTIGTWPVANTAYFCPMRLPVERTLVALGIYCSNPVSGNFDLGVYAPNGRRLASAGSTPQTAVNGIQKYTLPTPLILTRGSYYLAAVADNITGNYIRSALGPAGADFHRFLGMAEQAGAFPLPANATLGPITAQFIPHLAFLFAGAPV